MLDSLITSKTRIKLLMKFFINSETTAYLRNLSNEFWESTNGIRQELNRFEDAQLIDSEVIQNKKIYKANTHHPYYQDIHHLLLKFTGIDQLVEMVVSRVGMLDKAFIINDFAQGKPGNVLDLVLVGNSFDQDYLHQLVLKAEDQLTFKIRYITVSPSEVQNFLPDKTKSLLIWTNPTSELNWIDQNRPIRKGRGHCPQGRIHRNETLRCIHALGVTNIDTY